MGVFLVDKRGLAMEAARIFTEKDGVSAVSRTIGAVKITDVKIRENAAREIGKSAGRYITLEGEPSDFGMTALLQRALLRIIPERGRLFAAGLGNPDITPDSLGALAVRGITKRKTRHFLLSAIETDVAAKTGLDTAKLVRAAARELPADCVVVIDALACNNPRYIGKTVQITDAGLIPGSGAGCRRDAISRKTLGVPVAAIGVPTVTALSSVTKNPADSSFLVTTGDVDVIVRQWAEVISGALEEL